MNCRYAGIMAVILLSLAAGARDEQTLKSDLAAIMPDGKKARLAWIKGGNFTEFPFYASNTAVYVVDSDNGRIRRLYPLSETGKYFYVNITADGSHVLFYNGGSNMLCRIAWDGTGFEEIDVGGDAIEYWCDPQDGSDWAVTTANGFSRVKIDNPSVFERIAASGADVAGNGGGGLSDDGKYFLGYVYNHQPFDCFSLTNTTTMSWEWGPHGGCWGSISAGSNPRYNHNPSGHSSMCVHEAADQTQFTVYPVSENFQKLLSDNNLKLNCYEAESNECARFTHHPDFATFMSSKSSVNPVLMRLSDMKFVYMEDNLSCGFCGDMDAVFLPPDGTHINRSGDAPAFASAQTKNVKAAQYYSMCGRRLVAHANGKNALRGVCIQYKKGVVQQMLKLLAK